MSSMSERTTLAPWWAKRRAAALPTPWPAPVMMATCAGVSVGGIRSGGKYAFSRFAYILGIINVPDQVIAVLG